MHSRKQQIERLGHLIRDIEQVMFTTIGTDGSVDSRPMLVQDTPFDGSLWFFTHRASCKVESIVDDSRINLAFMDPGTNRFISMSGCAELINDDLMIKKMWSPKFEQWFGEGVADPDLALIRVHISHAEYWDTPHAEVVETFFLNVPPRSRTGLTPLAPQISYRSPPAFRPKRRVERV